jgi:uncharacterized protein
MGSWFKKDLLHPSVQVGKYQLYLEDTLTAFYEDNPIDLSACAYLHNYNYYSDDVIFADKFSEPLMKYPLFTGDDVTTDKWKIIINHLQINYFLPVELYS